MKINQILRKHFWDAFVMKWGIIAPEKWEITPSQIKQEILKVLPKKKECHHIGKDGYLIKGRYCDDCITYNQLLAYIVRILEGM